MHIQDTRYGNTYTTDRDWGTGTIECAAAAEVGQPGLSPIEVRKVNGQTAEPLGPNVGTAR